MTEYQKAKCKHCNKEFEALALLEHAAIDHLDKDAIMALDQLNKYRGGT